MIEFGEKNIIRFLDEESMYESIGYLANCNKRGMHISKENYGNKWGVEYRIWLTNDANAPDCIKSVLSKGFGNYKSRLNCNEFICFLIDGYCFSEGKIQDIDRIRNAIPAEYIYDFDRGYNL